MNKKLFNQTEHIPNQDFIPKQEFNPTDVQLDPEAIDSQALTGELLTEKFDYIVKPKPRWWKKVLGGTALLFSVAVIAQSVQWLVDSWQQNQWITFAFALVSFSIVILGISAIIKEWQRLVRLKRLANQQQQAQQLLQNSLADDGEKAKKLCLTIAQNMQLDGQHPNIVKWQNQINEAHSAQEIAYLFSQNVLQDLDQQAQKLVSKSAAEAAVIVAISPLALVDMFFVAWRNIRLINKIAKIYHIELGYISRLRLMRMILMNIAFAGASEVVQEIGMDWLSQDLTAKLSARVAQGIGIGLLTARLGIKTMEFCRPLTFRKDEKPRLNTIHRELLSTIKATVFSNRQKE